MMLRVLFVFALLLAAGPAFAQTPKSSAGPRKVLCTISSIGESFMLKRVGIMVFGNEETSVPIPDWKIDERVNALIGRLLQKNFQVKRLPLPRGGFSSLHSKPLREDEAGPIVQRIAGAAKCDYVLLVTSAGSQYSSSNQFVSGLGVLRAPGVVDGYAFVHALPWLLVYDGKSFELLRSKWHGALEAAFQPLNGPHKSIEGPYPEDMHEFVKDRKIREMVWTLLEDDLTKTVPTVFAAN